MHCDADNSHATRYLLYDLCIITCSYASGQWDPRRVHIFGLRIRGFRGLYFGLIRGSRRCLG